MSAPPPGVEPYTLGMRRGFTLIELLVVIAILAILAGLLFPVFARAKAEGKKTVCMSNLKQIGSAIALYMQDHDDIFPHAVDPSDKYRPEIWADFPDFQARIPHMPLMNEALEPYAKNMQIFQCPSDTGTKVLDNHASWDFPSSPSMYKVYGSSYFYRTEIAFKFFSDTRFQLPANVNVMFDGAGHWHGSGPALDREMDFEEMFSTLKGYRYNTLYGDWHVKSLTHSQLQMAWATPL